MNLDKLKENKVRVDRLKEIRERAEKATPGPWITVAHSWEQTSVFTDADDIQIAACLYQGDEESEESNDQNDRCAEFIAHARDDVPYLLQEVERLNEELWKWKVALSDERTKTSVKEFMQEQKTRVCCGPKTVGLGDAYCENCGGQYVFDCGDK